MTSSYSANIVVNVQNQKSLERTVATVGRLNSLIKQLKPINLLAPGAGSGADAVRTAMTEVIKKAKLANNSIAGISATFAGASSQASAFSEILANVKIDKLKAGKTLLESQNAEVRELASAFAKAEGKAGELQKRYQGLLQAARQAEGLAIGPATELGTLEAELQKRTYYEKQITEEKRKQERLDKEAIASARSRRRDAARRSETRRRDILTGAGFPLLFGGGPAQALAGGIGGAVGGLGGSIAASAITAQVETFAKEAAKVGQALNSTSGALELVREKSLFSKEAIKERAFQLEEQGRVEELAALLTGELTQLIGNEGVRSLQELGKTTSETTKLWNQLTTQLFALVSGPLNAFLKVVNQVLGAVAGAGSREAFFGDLGSQEGAARSRFKVLTGESLGTGRSGSKARAEARSAGQVFLSQEDALKQIRKEFKPVNPASIPVTKQDRRDFSVSGGRAKKERESRLPQLQIEIGLQERLLDLNNKIAEAKRAGNEGAAAVLEVEKIFEKTAANINKIKLEGLRKDEEAAKIRSEELKGLQQVENVNNRMRGLEAQKAESAANNIRRLENTLELSQAVTRVERERLEIEQELAKLSDQGMKGPQLAQAKSLLEQINEENAPLNSFIKKSMDSLTDSETRAVQVSQGIGNAIATPVDPIQWSC